MVTIDLAENNLSGRIQKGFSKLTGLRQLIMRNNNLEVLSDLSEMDNLVHLDVGGNRLNFRDLVPNNLVGNYIYVPQDSIGSNLVHNKTTGERLALAVHDKNSGNRFSWMKDNELILPHSDSSLLIIDSLTLADAGKYHCKITNELLPELQIYAKAQHVSVLPRHFNKITDWEFLRGTHRTKGVNWIDFDGDSGLDLFLVGFDDRNKLIRNKGNNNGVTEFDEVSVSGITDKVDFYFGSSWADYNNDGSLDSYIITREPTSKNLLWRHENGHFTIDENSPELNNHFKSSRSTSWGDYDNDGWVDLMVANGWWNQLDDYKPKLFHNSASNIFMGSDIIDFQSGIEFSSWTDYDGDGDLDLFVANYGDDNCFYENLEEGNNWINIECQGAYSNRSAIGAKVRLKATINGKSHWQLREISAQTGFAAQNSLNVEFGLGDAPIIDSLVIEWPTTGKQTLTNIELNQFITVEEQPDLFLFPIKDIKIPQNDVITITLDVLYGGHENLIFSVNSDQEKIKSTIENNSLRLESGAWIGNDLVKVSVTDGQRSHGISLGVEVVEKGSDAGGGEVITGFPQPKRELNVNLFPNPTNGYATLIVKQAESHNLHIEIFNSLGEKIFQKKEKNIDSESSVQLPLNQFTPGVYIAKILIDDEFLTKKIIIK